MKKIKIFSLISLALLFIVGCADQQVNQEEPIESVVEAVFVSAEDGSKILAETDDYISVLSEFDYVSKFKSQTPLDENERLAFYKQHTLEWTDKDKEKVEQSLVALNRALSKMTVDTPKEIKFVLTDGVEESGAAYTRGEYIFYPKDFLESDMLDYLTAHEYFHVYSRYHLEEKDELYRPFGFKMCKPLTLPGEMASRRISNPDAPLFNVYIECNYDGKKQAFMPISYSNEPYDLKNDPGFFSYLQEPLILVEIDDENKPMPILKDGKPVLVNKEDLEDYYTQIGRNTAYTLHAEEIAADNFAMHVVGLPLESPEKTEALIKVMNELKK